MLDLMWHGKRYIWYNAQKISQEPDFKASEIALSLRISS